MDKHIIERKKNYCLNQPVSSYFKFLLLTPFFQVLTSNLLVVTSFLRVLVEGESQSVSNIQTDR